MIHDRHASEKVVLVEQAGLVHSSPSGAVQLGLCADHVHKLVTYEQPEEIIGQDNVVIHSFGGRDGLEGGHVITKMCRWTLAPKAFFVFLHA